MDVILTKDVKNQGKKGDVIDVSDGYARNFLFPRGLAKEATEGYVKEIKARKKAEKRKEMEQIEEAKELKEQLEGLVVEIKKTAGEHDKLFGSVTKQDIADKLKVDHGLEIDKKLIDLEDNIKNLGVTTVEVKLFQDVSADLKVKVINEEE